MDTLREFFTSSSGLAPARQGLGLGWVISALTGVAVLLSAKGAEAGKCESKTVYDCSHNAWCDSDSDGAEPFKCCKIEYKPDCSYETLYCECVA